MKKKLAVLRLRRIEMIALHFVLTQEFLKSKSKGARKWIDQETGESVSLDELMNVVHKCLMQTVKEPANRRVLVATKRGRP